MGRDLVCTFPAAMAALTSANAHFGPGCRLSDLIFPMETPPEAAGPGLPDPLQGTEVAQPAIGAVSLAMLDILRAFGIAPDATCGHSYGELPALYAAGRMNRDDLLRLSVLRGRLMAMAGKANPGGAGAMLAVRAPVDAVEVLIRGIDGAVLANRNGPEQAVVSGPDPAIAKVARRCGENGYPTVKLPVSAAFHSTAVAQAVEPLSEALEKTPFPPATTPTYANTTALPYPDDPAEARRMLAGQIAKPVRFLDQIENMYRSGVRTFIEVGPKTVLTGLIRSILQDRPHLAVPVDASSGRGSGMADLAAVLCRLAAAGHPVRLDRWEAASRQPQPQRMRVPITGANFRSPKPSTPGETIQTQPSIDPSPAGKTAGKAATMSRSTPPANRMTGPLEVIQTGLRSMQDLQRQTAEAHRLFLEGQTEISRTLRHMMENAGRMAGIPTATQIPADLPWPAIAATAPTPTPAAKGEPEVHVQDLLPPSPSDPLTAPAATKAAPPLVAVETDRPVSRRDTENTATVLMGVVSELTGYPVDMLTLDMDIEADLGIDSIKRVEILSNLEEKMPHLPQVSPEAMGSLKTLGQIVDYLIPASPQTQQPEMPSPDLPAAPDAAGSVQSVLMGVVSELTGYPVDMLAPEMDIEADLGIDSIKRVEILSSLEEKMPHLPQVSPEAMGSLKTLGQIVAYLVSGDAAPQAPIAGESVRSPAARASIFGAVRRRPATTRDRRQPDRPCGGRAGLTPP